jgi:pimeloyl-ACP methyl ester carboxylesterase
VRGSGNVCYNGRVRHDVVLLPSLGRPASDFADLVAQIEAHGFTTHAMEPSPTAPQGSTLHDLAQDVVERLDELRVEAFHLVGHAFGNRLARMVTADFPDRVASLTLLAAGGVVPPAIDVMDSLLASFDPTLSVRDHLDHVGRAFFAPGHDPSVWASGWLAEVARYQGAALEATPREHWWNVVAPRVLVIQGLDDVVAPAENGRRYVQEHQDFARLVELDDAGHALIVEQADLVGQAIVEFLLDIEDDHEPVPVG